MGECVCRCMRERKKEREGVCLSENGREVSEIKTERECNRQRKVKIKILVYRKLRVRLARGKYSAAKLNYTLIIIRNTVAPETNIENWNVIK